MNRKMKIINRWGRIGPIQAPVTFLNDHCQALKDANLQVEVNRLKRQLTLIMQQDGTQITITGRTREPLPISERLINQELAQIQDVTIIEITEV